MNSTTLSSEYLDRIYNRLIGAGAKPIPGDTPQFYFYLVQYRFPRSKKRRIRRKWANDRRNYRPVGPGDASLMEELGFDWRK